MQELSPVLFTALTDATHALIGARDQLCAKWFRLSPADWLEVRDLLTKQPLKLGLSEADATRVILEVDAYHECAKAISDDDVPFSPLSPEEQLEADAAWDVYLRMGALLAPVLAECQRMVEGLGSTGCNALYSWTDDPDAEHDEAIDQFVVAVLGRDVDRRRGEAGE